MSDLRDVPGIGKSIARDLEKLGIHHVKDLKNKDPEVLYQKLCDIEGKHLDRCLLYTFRCAVYYASHTKHDSAKLKWWNWKDKN